MSKKIIADTNIWHYLSKKNGIILNILKRSGILCCSPINFFEIASAVNEVNFCDKKSAAKAVIDYAEEYLPSNEIFLKQSWGFDCYDDIKWKHLYGELACAKNYEDFNNFIIKKFKVSPNESWRNNLYYPFPEDIKKYINRIIPNYIEKIDIGKTIPKIKDPAVLSKFNNEDFINKIIISTWDRLKYNSKKISDGVEDCTSELRFNEAKPKILCYATALAKYLKYLLEFGAKPEENDAGDLECFLFLRDDNYILATADKRWVKIGKEACPGKILEINIV